MVYIIQLALVKRAMVGKRIFNILLDSANLSCLGVGGKLLLYAVTK